MLSGVIPEDDRIVTIEDAAELQLRQPHVVSLETRPANLEGRGEYTIRDLVKNALRMRPDRIIVGECRGGEALDMLQAMNTGHDGSLTTTHANSPQEAISRLETLVLMAGIELPVRAIREQIAGSVHLIVQQSAAFGWLTQDHAHQRGHRDRSRFQVRSRRATSSSSCEPAPARRESRWRLPRDRIPAHLLERLHRDGARAARGEISMTRVSDVAPLTEIYKWAGGAAIVLSLFVGTWSAMADSSSAPYRFFTRYTSWLERKLRPMFIFMPGRHIAYGQVIAFFVVILIGMSIDIPMWGAALLVIALAPAVWIEMRRRERVLLIEEQLDNFVLALANALKSTPSIGAAFNTVVTVIQDPFARKSISRSRK